MNDCPNADIRDQLPDLLHERLDVSVRAAVMAHVDTCADCRAELELLRGVHGMLVARTPRVDVNYVVQALPKRAAQQAPAVRRRPAWSDWRIAAAVTVLAVGGGSFAVLRQNSAPAPLDTMFAAPPTAQGVATPIKDASAPAKRADTVLEGRTSAPHDVVASNDEQPGLATTARLADLNERQLQLLLDQIDQLQAVPITEPEPVTIKIESKRTSPEGA
jgi:anti-sigma factor RsiW